MTELLLMKKSNIHQDRIIYKSQKTNKFIIIQTINKIKINKFYFAQQLVFTILFQII
jgi:hypothetical protein